MTEELTSADAVENAISDLQADAWRWIALDYSGYCYASNPPESLPDRCNLTRLVIHPSDRKEEHKLLKSAVHINVDGVSQDAINRGAEQARRLRGG